jgi:O-acetyl-ADP-ribose deacetylase (regulator of RNase III)
MFPRSAPRITCIDEISTVADDLRSGRLLQSPTLEASPSDPLASMVSLWKGDITTLKIDCIVNAANSQLQSGGGVCGAIFQKANFSLLQPACNKLSPISPGETAITPGFRLPASFIAHTVGPMGQQPDVLRAAYQSALSAAYEQGCRTIAFPCISTGIYGYSSRNACPVALSAVREWLEAHNDFGRVIFCLFTEEDIQLYKRNTPAFFPLETPKAQTTA